VIFAVLSVLVIEVTPMNAFLAKITATYWEEVNYFHFGEFFYGVMISIPSLLIAMVVVVRYLFILFGQLAETKGKAMAWQQRQAEKKKKSISSTSMNENKIEKEKIE
jgi:hypothetical protein